MLEIVCWDLTLSHSLFYSTGASITKPVLPIAFLGCTEETVYFHESDEWSWSMMINDKAKTNYGFKDEVIFKKNIK